MFSRRLTDSQAFPQFSICSCCFRIDFSFNFPEGRARSFEDSIKMVNMKSLQLFKKQLLNTKFGRYSHKYYYKYNEDRKLQSADVIVVSFPKSGRTWLRVLLGKIISERYGKEFTIELEELADENVPFIYMTHDEANKPNKPNKPLRFNKNEYRNKKVLFLVRDPRDVVISYYFQQTKRIKSSVTMDVSSFIRDPRYGVNRIIGLMNIWAENRRIPKDFLVVKYEDLHRDPVGELQKIMQFVGLKDVEEELLREAVSFASFENMRQMERNNALQNKRLKTKDSGDPEAYKVRKGKIGGYVDYLSEADVDYLNNRVKEGLVKEYEYV